MESKAKAAAARAALVALEQRSLKEIEDAECKGGPGRGDQCELDGGFPVLCWRHNNRYDLAANLAARRTQAAQSRVTKCSGCRGKGRVRAPDRLADREDNTRPCPACFGSGQVGIGNPFCEVFGIAGGELADSLARAVDSDRKYALEAWLVVAACMPYTARLRAAFGPFVKAGKVDPAREPLLCDFARLYLKAGEDCEAIEARKAARAAS